MAYPGLQMIFQRLALAKELLAEHGNLFVHCDFRVQAYLRRLLDELFGRDNFLNEIIWHYTGGGRSRTYFSRKHDTVFWYRKGSEHTFNIDAVRIPYKETSGYAKGGIVSASGKHYMPHPDGTPADDVWDIPNEATIPGAAVSGPGIDCFFIATNAEGSARSFPTAALEPAIRGPQILIGANTRPSVSVNIPPSDLTPGEPVEFMATVDGHGTAIAEVLLFSRPVGAREYRSGQMTSVGGGTYAAEIPGEIVQEQGIEVAIIATDNLGLRGNHGQLYEPVVWTPEPADIAAGLPVTGCGPTCGIGAQAMALLSIVLLAPCRRRIRSRPLRP